jgi:hypothetical protein
MFFNYECLHGVVSLDEIPKVACSLTVMVMDTMHGYSGPAACVPWDQRNYILMQMSTSVKFILTFSSTYSLIEFPFIYCFTFIFYGHFAEPGKIETFSNPVPFDAIMGSPRPAYAAATNLFLAFVSTFSRK